MNEMSLPLIGQGRGCLVYDLGDGTVLRRYRVPTTSAAAEAAAMWRAAQAGVPVPHVHTVTDSAMRMDRVEGPTILDQLMKHPDQAAPCGRVLAELHRTLDRTGSPASALVHGDLHPGNVLMSVGGPVLIDWTNHRIAPRGLDVALTWLVLGCFDPGDDVLRRQLAPARKNLLGSFLAEVDARSVAAYLPQAAAIRRADPGTSPEEHLRITRLLSNPLSSAPG